MSQDKKLILLEELWARTPYGVKVNAPFTSDKNENAKGYKITGINFGVVEWTPTLFGEKKRRNSIIIEAFSEKFNQYCSIDLGLDNNIEEVKPYLFPLSSITEEIMDEIYEVSGVYDIDVDSPIHIEVGTTFEDLTKIFHILNKHHIDYRGLIPMGLALDATGLGIYP